MANKVDSDEFVKNVLQSLPKGPLRISMAKEMFPIVDMPILFYHLKECVDSGITDCLIISKKEKFRKSFWKPFFFKKSSNSSNEL